MLASTIQRLEPIAETGAMDPQEQGVGLGETTETSAAVAPKPRDSCAPTPSKSQQCDLIGADTLPPLGIDIPPLEFDIAGDAKNVITDDTLPPSAIDILPLEFDITGGAKNVIAGASVCLAGETNEPVPLENWRIENGSAKSIQVSR